MDVEDEEEELYQPTEDENPEETVGKNAEEKEGSDMVRHHYNLFFVLSFILK